MSRLRLRLSIALLAAFLVSGCAAIPVGIAIAGATTAVGYGAVVCTTEMLSGEAVGANAICPPINNGN